MNIIDGITPSIQQRSESVQKTQPSVVGRKKIDNYGEQYSIHEPQNDDVHVNFSNRSMEVGKTMELITNAPDKRIDKINDIKSQIQDGTYKIDYDLTAEKVINVLRFGDI